MPLSLLFLLKPSFSLKIDWLWQGQFLIAFMVNDHEPAIILQAPLRPIWSNWATSIRSLRRTVLFLGSLTLSHVKQKVSPRRSRILVVFINFWFVCSHKTRFWIVHHCFVVSVCLTCWFLGYLVALNYIGQLFLGINFFICRMGHRRIELIIFTIAITNNILLLFRWFLIRLSFTKDFRIVIFTIPVNIIMWLKIAIIFNDRLLLNRKTRVVAIILISY